MGVLLGLGDALLAQTGGAHHLREQTLELPGRVGDGERIVRVVLGHRHELEVRRAATLEPVEVGQGQRGDELAHAVGAEVEAQHSVAVLHPSLRGIPDAAGLDELVPHVVPVGALDRLSRRIEGLTDSSDKQIEGARNALPALVAIHSVVATDHRNDAPDPGIGDVLLERAHVVDARTGRSVATVEQRVHADLVRIQPALGRHLEQRPQVEIARVHPTVGDQTHEVQLLAGALARVHQPGDGAVLEEVPGLDRLVDARDVLIHDPPGAEVHVSDLAVAHQPQGQADLLARSGQERVRIAAEEVLEERSATLDRVVFLLFAVSPSVEDDQKERSVFHLVYSGFAE